ncbi:putative flagellar hook-length control protein [Bacillus velezensis]|nr:putative flagellar hook-length control protein [Bacillus velezensis]
MKLLELTGNRTQTAQNSNVKMNVNSLGLFQNWLLSEITSPRQPGDETKTSDAELNDALSKIGDWLKAGPEDKELQLKQLLEAVKALEGKQTAETALPLLKQLAESVEDMLAGKQHGGSLKRMSRILPQKTGIPSRMRLRRGCCSFKKPYPSSSHLSRNCLTARRQRRFTRKAPVY